MPLEIFYFRDEHGRSAVEEQLKALRPKAFARSLAMIDLLESGEPLPAKLDRAVAQDDGDTKSDGSGASAEPVASARTLRFLTIRSERGRASYYYAPAAGNKVIVLDLLEGRRPRKGQVAKLADAARHVGEDQNGNLKSHREYVAESTLGDADLAALYARARERAQFSLAMIRLREAASHTPESLAERTGLSRALILSVERGHIPKLAALRRLVDALNAQLLITPGSGLAISPASSEAKPDATTAAATTLDANPAVPAEPAARRRSRAAATKPLPPSKASKPAAAAAKPRQVPAREAQPGKPTRPRQTGTRQRTAGKRPAQGAEPDASGDTGAGN